MNDYKLLVETLSGAPLDQVLEVLTESKFDDEHRENQNFYTLMMEQFIDECSCYAFEGWEDLEVWGRPYIEKFWVEFKLIAPEKFDFDSGARRIIGKDKENKITLEPAQDGRKVITLRILRSILDKLDEENQKHARKKAEERGLVPDAEPQNQEEDEFDSGGPF